MATYTIYLTVKRFFEVYVKIWEEDDVSCTEKYYEQLTTQAYS